MFFCSDWHHDGEEPIQYYCEVDEFRFEIRKIEKYRDGRLVAVDAEHETEGNFLSDAEIPPLDEINADPEFTAWEISRDEFEVVWAEATKNC